MTNKEVDAILQGFAGYDEKTWARVVSFAPTKNQIVAFRAYAHKKGVDINKKAPEGGLIVPFGLSSASAFRYCLTQLGFEVRYHETRGQQVLYPNTKEWVDCADDERNNIFQEYVTLQCHRQTQDGFVQVNYPKTTRDDVFSFMAMKKKYHPIREWLQSIPAKENPSSVDRWLECYRLDGNNTLADAGKTTAQIIDYYTAGILSIGAGLYRRVTDPGCLYDVFVVLVGDQGCGKGLGLKLLLPVEITTNGQVIANECFCSNGRIGLKNEGEMYNELQKRKRSSLCEISELVGLNKSMVEALKAHISSSVDYVRPKYHRDDQVR